MREVIERLARELADERGMVSLDRLVAHPEVARYGFEHALDERGLRMSVGRHMARFGWARQGSSYVYGGAKRSRKVDLGERIAQVIVAYGLECGGLRIPIGVFVQRFGPRAMEVADRYLPREADTGAILVVVPAKNALEWLLGGGQPREAGPGDLDAIAARLSSLAVE